MPQTFFPYPAREDYHPYFHTYIRYLEPGVDILRHLADQLGATQALLDAIDEERADFRYAPGKWSLKEVLGHVIDAERVFAYRALVFARGDASPLPGFDQDEWVARGHFDQLPWSELTAATSRVREATLCLFRSFTAEMPGRTGTADGRRFTAGSYPFIIAGHELHHLKVIRERYLS